MNTMVRKLHGLKKSGDKFVSDGVSWNAVQKQALCV